MQLKWTELADTDLDIIEEHITQDNDALIAIDVVMTIIETIEKVLPEHPKAGRTGRVKQTRALVIDSIPYIVIYRITSHQLEILRVLHDAQQWPT